MVRRIVGDTMMAWGARLGAVWIGVLVVCAVLAPLLANSLPLVMKARGRWSSPALRAFAPADVVLIVAAITAGLLLVRRRKPQARKSMLIFLGVVAAAALVAGLWVRPPEVIVYERYREMAAAGRIERAVYAPIPFSPRDHLRDQPRAAQLAPSARHPMGTDIYGGDLASELIHASRIALAVGFIATGIAVVIGVVVGGLMGYFVGAVDLVGMRLVEIFEAVPRLFLLIAFVAFFNRNIYLIMAVIGLTSWSGYARFLRAEFLRLRQQDFVVAARACGLPLHSILFRHMLPNGVAPVLVSVSFGVASAILAESTLSFLGLGLVNTTSWGTLLNQALGGAGNFTWWIALYPGLAIFLTIFAYILIGESLRDAIDPHSRRVAQL
jgi:peptide/nickel transport system permease protein